MLRNVFTGIQRAGLTVRPTKCRIGYKTIDFTGHAVDESEVCMEEEQITIIKYAEEPTIKEQVRSFLGLANYYRKFIPNFATIAAPLTNLIKKGMPNKVVWGPAQERAFKTLRDLLTSSPILRLPDLSRQFILWTDA